MRAVISDDRLKLFTLILPYLYKDGDKTMLKDNAPDIIKKAFEEYMNLPVEPKIY